MPYHGISHAPRAHAQRGWGSELCDVGRAPARSQRSVHRVLHALGQVWPLQGVAQQQGGGADAGHGVGLVAPRNAQRRAMTRLEQALTTLGLRIAQQGCGGQADGAGEYGGRVAQDIAKQVAGQQYIKVARLGDERHGRVIGVQVAQRNWG